MKWHEINGEIGNVKYFNAFNMLPDSFIFKPARNKFRFKFTDIVSCNDFLESKVGRVSMFDNYRAICKIDKDSPMVNISLLDAKNYCSLLNARIPNEQEWFEILYTYITNKYNFNEWYITLHGNKDVNEILLDSNMMLGNGFEMTSTVSNKPISNIMKGGDVINDLSHLDPFLKATFNITSNSYSNLMFRCVR
ncbi:SUMF1/EgtB/PvdO family nonheme iron enzyme [Vibrio neonatus]|uniref:SUMF1/EgtB/PvdO family nonheme iron enzyme n=1 Tax=Vibrio neonatus TaxID=278860 RepID=UPI0021C3675B|nr:SUMF1/EgtB/PvdO family nonheme iron enzyme [Vibrio neonatus]